MNLLDESQTSLISMLIVFLQMCNTLVHTEKCFHIFLHLEHKGPDVRKCSAPISAFKQDLIFKCPSQDFLTSEPQVHWWIKAEAHSSGQGEEHIISNIAVGSNGP